MSKGTTHGMTLFRPVNMCLSPLFLWTIQIAPFQASLWSKVYFLIVVFFLFEKGFLSTFQTKFVFSVLASKIQAPSNFNNWNNYS